MTACSRPLPRPAPDLRAAWHEALAALGPADGPDVRGMPDETLLHLRDTYPLETAWAPRWVGDELRQVRTGAVGAGEHPDTPGSTTCPPAKAKQTPRPKPASAQSVNGPRAP
jgi:hypothetical protein